MASRLPPDEVRISRSFGQLAQNAKPLNIAGEELTKEVLRISTAVAKLDLGISAWVPLTGNKDDGDANWWSRDLGYARVRSLWGIALRELSGNYNQPDRDSEEVWFFGDAPRWMQMEAVSKIPDLLESLCKQADETTKKLKKKTEQARQLAQAIATGKTHQDWQSRLHQALVEMGLMFSADAIAASNIEVMNDELVVTTDAQYRLMLCEEDIKRVLAHLGSQTLKLRLIFLETKQVDNAPVAVRET